ncbi:MAG TPA: hypothetical protein VFA20_23995 [Myxococcaceae bacterium]|nr:hypothetical protein [Myxococcaceae bacterium]
MKWTKVLVALGLGLATLGAASPRAIDTYRRWQEERRQTRIAQAWESVKNGQDYLSFNPEENESEMEELLGNGHGIESRLPEQDDPRLRSLVNAAEWGYPNHDFSVKSLEVARQEAQRWASKMPGAPHKTVVGDPNWQSLGPTDTAKPQYNGDEYVANDSGRAQAIRLDPLDAGGNTVYLAVSGGGLWRTTNFNATTPTWTPLTDTVGNLAIGAMDLFPGASAATHTIWLGLGDFTDAPSGMLIVSHDSGATWSAGIQLTGRYTNGTVFEPQAASPATRIRDLKIDPANPNIVMVATDVGLFRSTNAASATPTFSLIDLPNPGAGNAGLLKEAPWSFAYLGTDAVGVSQWLVTGVAGQASATAYGTLPPVAGGGNATVAGIPVNFGDIWKSTDGGATWTSARAGGLLAPILAGLTSYQIPNPPNPPFPPVQEELGRMALAAGTPVAGDPTQTVVYVQAGPADEVQTQSLKQVAVFKTTNSGASWTLLGTNTKAVANPSQEGGCGNLDAAHGQAWYNLAIAVDPSNSNNIILGGNLCSIRSIDGGLTFQNVSHWLPLPRFGALGFPQGNTDVNFSVYLPYVHADWHTALVGPNGRVFAGSDGGLFMSDNVFTTATVDPNNMPITWRQMNAGLVTHLHYSIASGDPVLGNQRYAFTGLQDNGTRMRDTGNSTKWNQVVGGDGVAAAISIYGDASHQVFLHSLPGRRQLCRPGERFFVPGSFDPAIKIDCNSGLLHPNQGVDDLNTEFLTWNRVVNPNLPNGDSEPFLLRIIPTNDGLGTMFTISTQYAWKMHVNDDDTATYELISNIFANRTANPPAAVRSPRGMMTVTPWTYTTVLNPGSVGAPEQTFKSRLYGVPLSGGWYYIGLENSYDTLNGVPLPWSWTSSQTVVGSTGGTGVLQQMLNTSSIDFPRDPTHLGAPPPVFPTDLMRTYIVSSQTPADTGNQLVRDDVGRIFKTTNNGVSFTSIAPVSSGMPNTPVNIVRFDPGDPTDQTIYAGTDLGVYRTTNGGATWTRYGNGFPLVRVTDMSFARNGSLLRVATYGRGIWEIYPHQKAPTAAGDGDWDKNGRVDFLDLAAAASRLGKNPTVESNPRYDSTLDIGNHSTIDNSDLSALLSKYGSNP